MIISHIVAVAKGGVIGLNGVMPWHVEGELNRFRQLTLGAVVLLGRRTYQGLPKKLDGRKLIVLSRQMAAEDGIYVARTLEQAFAMASGQRELFIAGGAQIYRATLDIIDKLYLTKIDLAVAGDSYYPLDRLADYRCVYSQTFQTNAKFTYQTYLTPHYLKQLSVKS